MITLQRILIYLIFFVLLTIIKNTQSMDYVIIYSLAIIIGNTMFIKEN